MKEKKVELEQSTIGKVLRKRGYRWLPRSQKPKYSKKDRAARVTFAEEVIDMKPVELRRYLCMCLDGVIWTVPPKNPVDRENYCRCGESHMWRKSSEAAKAELSGGSRYDKQTPLARCVPMWGGIGVGGIGVVMFHKLKKIDTEQWVSYVSQGKLVAACRAARPDWVNGPWNILCDNESFLKARGSKGAYKKKSVRLWHIPPRSPDLNPVERFWGYMKKRLRAMDLDDLVKKRTPVGATTLKARVRNMFRQKGTMQVARNLVLGLRKTCREVVKKKGAATRG